MAFQRLKLLWLKEKIGFTELQEKLLCGRHRIKEAMFSDDFPLPATISKRLDSLFQATLAAEKIEELKVKYKYGVKNFDDDETLSEVKAGTSRHGVNRQSSSFATNNNGVDF